MNTLDAIYGRRSIRQFKPDKVAKELIEEVTRAGMQAPSGINRQPWRFTVLGGEMKEQLCRLMVDKSALLKKFHFKTEGLDHTIDAMRQAPTIILVFNTGIQPKSLSFFTHRYMRLIDIQSIGGAIQTMLLAAKDLGFGTLWICNIYYAEKAIRAFLGAKEELIAAIALGYADEEPSARPRRDIHEVMGWKV